MCRGRHLIILVKKSFENTSPGQANLLKIGNLKLLGSSLGEAQNDSLGGEEEGRDSASEQNEPLLDESLEDEFRNGRLLDMLKYLSS